MTRSYGPRRKSRDIVPIDTFSDRPVGEPIPLRECAAYAEDHACDVLSFARSTERMRLGLPPGAPVPGPVDYAVVYRHDAFKTLAALARVIAGPEGSGREAKVRAYLRRLIAEEKAAAGAAPHDAAAAAADADLLS